jgi:hypothetical protein
MLAQAMEQTPQPQPVYLCEHTSLLVVQSADYRHGTGARFWLDGGTVGVTGALLACTESASTTTIITPKCSLDIAIVGGEDIELMRNAMRL